MLPPETHRLGSSVHAVAIAATLLLTPAAVAQSPYAQIVSPRHPFFGEGVDILGDVNGDGFDDYVISSRVEHTIFSGRTGVELSRAGSGAVGPVSAAGDVNNDGFPDLISGFDDGIGPGTATVFAGPNWTVLYSWTGTVPGEGYSTDVKGIGDADGDGHSDVAVTSAQWGTPLPGYTEVRSGRTGAILRTFTGGPFGVGAPGDINGDGLDDLVVQDSVAGEATLYSVVSGEVLHTWSSTRQGFGSHAVGVGDIDMDGVNDLALSDELAGLPGMFRVGAVRVYSGGSFNEIRTLWGQSARQRFGRELDVVGDVTGDGKSEIVVGTGVLSGGADTVFIIDVVNETELFSMARAGERFGHWLGAGGDVNGDGIPDAIAGAPLSSTPPNGYAQLISGATLSLTTDAPSVSLSAGGSQTLDVQVDPSLAGSIYFILGSASGISPGFSLGGSAIPLNPDGYLFHTAQFPSLPPLGNTLGILDASGQAQASWSIPPGLPLPSGITLEHACLVLSPMAQVLDVTNAMPITLVN